METTVVTRFGMLAAQYCGKRRPVVVCSSAAGFYLGTFDEEGPLSRESAEYWKSKSAAEQALENGDWTQRLTP